jgi:hypothetical protein
LEHEKAGWPNNTPEQDYFNALFNEVIQLRRQLGLPLHSRYLPESPRRDHALACGVPQGTECWVMGRKGKGNVYGYEPDLRLWEIKDATQGYANRTYVPNRCLPDGYKVQWVGR